MAGLDRNKKRSGSRNPRVSRFSEVLGAAHESTHKSGYPESQPSKQSSPLAKEESTPQAGYPDSQQPAQPTAQPDPSPPAKSPEKSGYPNSQPSSQSSTQPSASPSEEKLAKRSNPDYTQTTFRIPKKLSRQINRALMDLVEEEVEIDRSDLLEELAGAFIRLADEVGAVSALSQFKNLGTQVDE